MGNVSKIAVLTAVITLAFGMTAINVTMAEERTGTVIMRIEIFSDGTTKVVPSKDLKSVSGFKAVSELLYKENAKMKELRSATIWWGNPGYAWVQCGKEMILVWCYQ